jgi:two-component system, OmpR family, response regulator
LSRRIAITDTEAKSKKFSQKAADQMSVPKKRNILLVEDDTATASFIITALEEAGFAVDHSADGPNGHARARNGDYDAVILDRMLPNLDGLSILNSMRAAHVNTPTIFLSAMGTVDDRVDGLRAGSNDYLTKPFSVTELVARVNALLRKRPELNKTESIHVVDNLQLNLISRAVVRDGRLIELQPREFRLLEYLMRHVDQVVTRKMLLEGVWDCHFDPGTNVIDVHVSRLRKKLDERFDRPLLHTVRGVGYRFGMDA